MPKKLLKHFFLLDGRKRRRKVECVTIAKLSDRLNGLANRPDRIEVIDES